MFMSPGAIVFNWFRGLLSVAIAIGAVWLMVGWYHALPNTVVISDNASAVHRDDQTRDVRVTDGSDTRTRSLSPMERVAAWRPGFDRETAMLLGGLLLVTWSLAGRFLKVSRLFTTGSAPVQEILPGAVQRLKRPDGSEIHMEIRGPDDAPTVILTHGWSLDSREWLYLQHDWGNRFRVVTWDLAGLGKSTQPANGDLSLEKMAGDLLAVIEASGPGPVVLMGHSIGGMTILTFCRQYAHLLGSRVSKLVLIHTTYINPLRTMFLSGLWTSLQKPLVEPLLYLQIALSPVVWVMNCLSYYNGSVHSSVSRTGFYGSGNQSKIDFVARFYPFDSPAVLARGALGMLAYDATQALPKIPIPTLVVGADEDPVTLVEASQHIRKEVASGQLSTLKQAKHFGLIEHNAEFAELTAEFILSNRAVSP